MRTLYVYHYDEENKKKQQQKKLIFIRLQNDITLRFNFRQPEEVKVRRSIQKQKCCSKMVFCKNAIDLQESTSAEVLF